MISVRKVIKNSLRKFGYEIKLIDWTRTPKLEASKSDFCRTSSFIVKKHFEQTKETVDFLNEKYKRPVFGQVPILKLLKLLSECIGPSDIGLGGVSQLTHVLQVLDAMEKDGINDRDLLIAALVHDLGKLLLLTDEAPENVICFNTPIGLYENGIGLDQCYFQWNHDEFVYLRLKNYLPKHIAWLIRYHSIVIAKSEVYMNEKDKEYCERYLKLFQKYDQETKTPYFIPSKKIEDYKSLIEEYFPKTILF